MGLMAFNRSRREKAATAQQLPASEAVVDVSVNQASEDASNESSVLSKDTEPKTKAKKVAK